MYNRDSAISPSVGGAVVGGRRKETIEKIIQIIIDIQTKGMLVSEAKAKSANHMNENETCFWDCSHVESHFS